MSEVGQLVDTPMPANSFFPKPTNLSQITGAGSVLNSNFIVVPNRGIWLNCDDPRKPMTICIAAICESGKYIVAAADRMVTVPPPLNLEFEPPLSKIEIIQDGCVALASGALPYADDIISAVRGAARGQALNVRSICEQFKNAYANFRDMRFEEQVLSPQLGADFKAFRARGGLLPGYLQVQPNTYQTVVIQAQQFSLNTDFLIAGIDDTGTYMGVVTNPGTFFSTNKLGYATIGSGATHASVSLHLGGQTTKLTLEETLVSIYAAKRAAEVAPGVGVETDIAIISLGEVWTCSKPLMDKLKEAFDQCRIKAKPKLDDVKKIYDEQRSKK